MRVSRTEGADILGALRTYVVQGLTLEASYDGESGWQFGSVRDNDGVVAGSRLHNHLQSSVEHNMSRAHSRSTSLANPSLASLCQHSIAMILFPWGKGRCRLLSGEERCWSFMPTGGWD